jgi:hypothetical protein
MGVASRLPEVEHRGFTLTWAELNPARGRYDWAPVRKILDQASRQDFGVVLRLKASVTRRSGPWGGLQAVPNWVLKTYAPRRAKTRDREPRNFIEVAVPWNPGLQKAYLDFVEAFGEQGFATHPQLFGLYVHGISTSFGEEMWLDAEGYRRMRAVGFSPDVMRETFGARIRAWSRAFGTQAHRLGWVGAGWIAAGNESGEYRRIRRELDALALEEGLGRRWGNIESYNGQLEKNGQQLAESGRLSTDPRHPLVAETRFWAGENENWRGDPSEAFAYRRAVQRALQMEMRLLWVSDPGVNLDPVISAYFAQVAGKRPAESPDAWSVLRESEVQIRKHRRLVGNIERWLHQLDEAPRAQTRAVQLVERPPQSNDFREAQEWTARATQRAAGQDRMVFELDPRFLGSDTASELFVQFSWIDDGARWKLVVGEGAQARVSAPIQGNGDGGEKTTTLSLGTPAALGFAAVVEDGDLVVSVVRVLRELPEPAAGCAREGVAMPPDRSSAAAGVSHG